VAKRTSRKASEKAHGKPTPAAKPELQAKRDDATYLVASPGNGTFDFLLEYLLRTRGFDFSAYKRSSLQRRIQKRMQDVAIQNYGDYIDFLEVHPEEFGQLFNTILINVTSFFRDEGAWEYLAQEIIPRILERRRPAEPVRVWTAGCASGEEAYSLAILLAETLGGEALRQRVKIYGTDVDEEALNQARLAAYTAKQVQDVPPQFLDKYFDQVNGKSVFNKELRRSVIFGRHDLIQDAPISRVDLIACRNTLMYFNAETQVKILARFGFGLSDGGFLFLGRAETLLTRLDMFAPVDVKRRIFTKMPRNSPRERVFVTAQGINGETLNHAGEGMRLREAAFDADLFPHIVIDLSGQLAFANEAARELFDLSVNDFGRSLRDLEVSYRPLELRSHIDQAYLERRPITIREVEWSPSPQNVLSHVDVTIIPLYESGGSTVGAKIIFADITRYKRLEQSLEQSRQELETASEELQSANEELETTNEELQSTNEELETTNEELQSANEELQTMNEELQSANEELETTNDQLRERTEELDQVNGFNQVILSNLLDAVVVVDRDLRVTVWNRRAEDLWGLRTQEVKDKHLLNLDIGLPVEALRAPLRAILNREADVQEVTVPATNRHGKPVRVRVSATPLDQTADPPRGVILMMEEETREGR
jgi:two-component system, chemotaxis family, CheB/CheR fusion protein